MRRSAGGLQVLLVIVGIFIAILVAINLLGIGLVQ